MKIVIDAGHGYNTAGKRTVDGTMREWEFNSSVAEKLSKRLLSFSNVQIIRTDDPTGKRDVPLKERTDKANSLGADLFLSIHANGFGNGGWQDANGIETFAYKTQPKESTDLARVIQDSLIKATKLTNRGVKFADFHVLRESKMTSVLTEAGGFMTHKEDASRMKTDAYREKVADALCEALASFYKLKKKPAPAPVKQPLPNTLYRVQVGVFSSKENAERLADELKKRGYPAIITK